MSRSELLSLFYPLHGTISESISHLLRFKAYDYRRIAGLKTFGHPTGATGVRMVYENVQQLRGQAGDRQVKDATTALSHNSGGAPQTCGIAILGMP